MCVYLLVVRLLHVFRCPQKTVWLHGAGLKGSFEFPGVDGSWELNPGCPQEL